MLTHSLNVILADKMMSSLFELLSLLLNVYLLSPSLSLVL